MTLHATASDPVSLESVEGTLTRALTAWSMSSVALGTAFTLIGRARQRAEVAAFGRQTAAWGAVDGAIAGIGSLTRRRRGELSTAERSAKARTLRAVLLANAAADVVYIVGGAVIVARAAHGRPTLGMRRGDGVAVVTQGLFLLALDLSQARRLG